MLVKGAPGFQFITLGNKIITCITWEVKANMGCQNELVSKWNGTMSWLPPPWRSLCFHLCPLVSLFVCLSASNLAEKRMNGFREIFRISWTWYMEHFMDPCLIATLWKNGRTDFHKIFRICRAWHIKPSGSTAWCLTRLCHGPNTRRGVMSVYPTPGCENQWIWVVVSKAVDTTGPKLHIGYNTLICIIVARERTCSWHSCHIWWL